MISIVPYHETYESGIQALYDIPMEGMISLSLEKKPHSLIGAQIQTERSNIFVAIDKTSEEVIAVFNLGNRRHYYEGKIRSFPYFCDLRIRPDFQKSSVLLRVIRHTNELGLDLNLNPATTMVFADNTPMLKMIEAREKITRPTIIPYYQKIADIETLIFSKLPKKSFSKYLIRCAGEKDIPSMQDLQNRNASDLMMYYEFDKIGKSAYYHGLKITDFFLLFKEDKLLGMIGVWKTKGFKQTRVHSYHWLIKAMRPFYNLVGTKLLGLPRLPKPGALMKTLQLHSIIIDQRNEEMFHALLNGIKANTELPMMLSLDTRDPLYLSFSSLKLAIRKQGHLYSVSYGKKATVPSWVPVDVVRI